jgi:hypothetical protein
MYMVVLLTGFHSISHGSTDFYPAFLKNQAGMSPTQTTVITAVGQIGPGGEPEVNEWAELKAADMAKHVERVHGNVVGV